jgi:branched-chain amino acid transport system permease protein
MEGNGLTWNRLWLCAAGVAIPLFPFFAGDQFLHVMIMAFLYAYLGSCWNILCGYGGQFSIGHSVFFGIGAYTSTLLFMRLGISPWLGMLAGGILAALVGLGFGFLTFRFGLKGHFFALATIALCKGMEIIALNWDFVGGAAGLVIPPHDPSFVVFQFDKKVPFYYIMYGLMLLSILVVFLVNRSKLGLYLAAIREDEAAAQALGVTLVKYKIYAIVLSAFLTGLGGTFFAQYLTYIDPTFTIGIGMSIEIIVRPILGGVGTVMGPILGAFILDPLAELSRNFLGGYTGAHMVSYGILLIVCCLFMPNGIIEIPFFARIFGRKVR